ncbi:MAG TPA: phosphoribosylformylglycinamidine cyclo-ligase [Candidatus Omnitrophota bacterium]|nr:phosphoribosylformylglycinamidine cyclo-ligase [Candidatus Omnitrophota bacterium]HPD84353.1 phosphoribosylformylglycinamidine cyclo-ligase [Candidatus Omnitrophota bacterium]HRZ03211.1 phosphoribosylformylglycinamidine cyclo-ligase [Candidatus Omnitrophota bacterium]
MKQSMTYKKSGVDIKQADVFVKGIQGLMKQTMNASVLCKHKAFGSLFALDKKKFKNPVLVSSTDGVGTKLLIAKHANKHDTVGIDLVAMNVNDVLCTGARPLFFLDYIACGQVKPQLLKEVVKGIAIGCRQAGCSLIGGETAEMPGIYKKDDYDLAGFTVGIVEKDKIIDGSKIERGDILIGVESSGLHSNGFSLVRKVFSLPHQKRLAKELLKPTRIYVKEILPLIEKFNIKGIAHITGGAFYEKLTKIIPEGKCCLVYKGSWPVPKIFQTIQAKGNVPEREMFTTFNMGIGLVLIVQPKDVAGIQRFLAGKGLKSWKIGSIINNKNKIIL